MKYLFQYTFIWYKIGFQQLNICNYNPVFLRNQKGYVGFAFLGGKDQYFFLNCWSLRQVLLLDNPKSFVFPIFLCAATFLALDFRFLHKFFSLVILRSLTSALLLILHFVTIYCQHFFFISKVAPQFFILNYIHPIFNQS